MSSLFCFTEEANIEKINLPKFGRSCWEDNRTKELYLCQEIRFEAKKKYGDFWVVFVDGRKYRNGCF